jgi:hypothetical protein
MLRPCQIFLLVVLDSPQVFEELHKEPELAGPLVPCPPALVKLVHVRPLMVLASWLVVEEEQLGPFPRVAILFAKQRVKMFLEGVERCAPFVLSRSSCPGGQRDAVDDAVIGLEWDLVAVGNPGGRPS